MTLLTSMLERPLDPGYAASAEAREDAGLPRVTGLRSPLLVVAAILIGLLISVAAVNLTGAGTSKSRARAELAKQIESRRESVDELRTTASDLQAEVQALESSSLAADPAVVRQVDDLSVVAGARALTGPGLVVTLDDAPELAEVGDGSNPRADTSDADGRVIARDLQFVSNSLWEAGAEAIAINGQRLTTWSSIRFAGAALLVDYRPLTRPYRITALGDPGTLPATFADGGGGTYLSTLKSSFGVQVDTRVADALTVPAAVFIEPRYADTRDNDLNDSASPAGIATSRPPTPTAEGTP